ncbi:hypothetical protein EDC01DRAFT_465666 [Geopyxis carbonaria]|nr:hypothetical protein EDC01DRAFT_465666 [Geopyxis carbonaria]
MSPPYHRPVRMASGHRIISATKKLGSPRQFPAKVGQIRRHLKRLNVYLATKPPFICGSLIMWDRTRRIDWLLNVVPSRRLEVELAYQEALGILRQANGETLLMARLCWSTHGPEELEKRQIENLKKAKDEAQWDDVGEWRQEKGVKEVVVPAFAETDFPPLGVMQKEPKSQPTSATKVQPKLEQIFAPETIFVFEKPRSEDEQESESESSLEAEQVPELESGLEVEQVSGLESVPEVEEDLQVKSEVQQEPEQVADQQLESEVEPEVEPEVEQLEPKVESVKELKTQTEPETMVTNSELKPELKFELPFDLSESEEEMELELQPEAKAEAEIKPEVTENKPEVEIKLEVEIQPEANEHKPEVIESESEVIKINPEVIKVKSEVEVSPKVENKSDLEATKIESGLPVGKRAFSGFLGDEEPELGPVPARNRRKTGVSIEPSTIFGVQKRDPRLQKNYKDAKNKGNSPPKLGNDLFSSLEFNKEEPVFSLLKREVAPPSSDSTEPKLQDVKNASPVESEKIGKENIFPEAKAEPEKVSGKFILPEKNLCTEMVPRTSPVPFMEIPADNHASAGRQQCSDEDFGNNFKNYSQNFQQLPLPPLLQSYRVPATSSAQASLIFKNAMLPPTGMSFDARGRPFHTALSIPPKMTPSSEPVFDDGFQFQTVYDSAKTKDCEMDQANKLLSKLRFTKKEPEANPSLEAEQQGAQPKPATVKAFRANGPLNPAHRSDFNPAAKSGLKENDIRRSRPSALQLELFSSGSTSLGSFGTPVSSGGYFCDAASVPLPETPKLEAPQPAPMATPKEDQHCECCRLREPEVPKAPAPLRLRDLLEEVKKLPVDQIEYLLKHALAAKGSMPDPVVASGAKSRAPGQKGPIPDWRRKKTSPLQRSRPYEADPVVPNGTVQLPMLQKSEKDVEPERLDRQQMEDSAFLASILPPHLWLQTQRK